MCEEIAMNGGGRVARTLDRPGLAPLASRLIGFARRRRIVGRRGVPQAPRSFALRHSFGPLPRSLRAVFHFVEKLPIPRGFGVAATAAIFLATFSYGAVRGGHMGEVTEQFNVLRDSAANAVGFRITGIALSGQRHLTREEILAIAGVSGRTSILFIDVADARLKLKTNPWIADATVQKLYPDRLQIGITEREAFALWQKDGRVGVIAEDGTVLEPYVARRFTALPLFVGTGADRHAKEFSQLIARYPAIREHLRASVLVAERRWNLRLDNGIDVRLPESDPAGALDRLVALARDKQLLAKDITVIDLRLPDRISVRLSDAAAAARAEALKAKTAKPKGGAV
jgi:cell division protein FtsQ